MSVHLKESAVHETVVEVLMSWYRYICTVSYCFNNKPLKFILNLLTFTQCACHISDYTHLGELMKLVSGDRFVSCSEGSSILFCLTKIHYGSIHCSLNFLWGHQYKCTCFTFLFDPLRWP